MSILQNDREVLDEGRKNTLENDPTIDVEASVRDRIITRLVDTLEEKDIGQKVKNMWSQANNDRAEWLRRQEEYLSTIDEFIDPIYESSTDWGSTLHLPTILTVCKTFHARMFSAIMSIDPPFTVRARNGANVDRARKIQDLMRYTVHDYANCYQGVANELDAWVWDWVTAGQGFLKAKWLKKYTRFEDVEETVVSKVDLSLNPETGALEPREMLEIIERPVVKTEEVFNGPELVRVPIEDIVVIGGKGEIEPADAVIHREYLTSSDLLSLSDQKIFLKSAVEKVIEAGPSSEERDVMDSLKIIRAQNAGESDINKTFDHDRYEVLEAYLQVDVDGSGIFSDIIVWVSGQTGEILRATYLRRVVKSGLRPFFKIGFHKRFGANNDVGIVELLYSLGKEVDAIHNMKIDTGILTSLPFGFYRPTNAFSNESLPIEPGALIPTSDPQRDIFFPNLGNRTSFGLQEEAALQNHIERLTSISDFNLGLLSGGQGATRTATGSRLLAGESSANLDIFLQRLNRGWKSALVYLFGLLQEKLPPGLEYRILGDDGNEYFDQVESKAEIQGKYDFELEANSSNSNPALQQERANQIYQLTQNPIDLQLGLVNPGNRYEAVRNLLVSLGVKDISKYLTKPMNVLRVFTPLEIADRLLRGSDVPLDPTQDLQGFIDFVASILESDDMLGQFSENDIAALVAKSQEAQQMLAALQTSQNDQAVIRQQGLNSDAFFGGGLQGRIEADSSQGVI